MKFEIKNNLLYKDDTQVIFVDTPNKSTGSIVPKYTILHFTADTNPSSTISWFKSKDAKASAHLLIDRSGNVTQFVKFNQKAWHAGVSEWKNLEGLNSFSVGIELTNTGRLSKIGDKYFFGKTIIPEKDVINLTHKNESSSAYWQTYTPIQLQVAKAITQTLVKHYDMLDVLGHDDIAPGRKSDPGPAFPMLDFKPVHILDYYILTSNVNFRIGPSKNDKAIEVLPKGSLVKELERKGDWSRITFVGKIGWVNNTYMKIAP